MKYWGVEFVKNSTTQQFFCRENLSILPPRSARTNGEIYQFLRSKKIEHSAPKGLFYKDYPVRVINIFMAFINFFILI